MTRAHAPSRNSRVLELLLVFGTALLLMLILLARTSIRTPGDPNFAVPADHQQYIHMAVNGVFDHHIAPYGWRIGTPLVASSLPMDLVDSFLSISFVSLWLTAVVIYYLVREFAFPRGVALTALVGFISMGWAVKHNVQAFWLSEPPAFLLLTFGMLLLAKGRPIAASGTMAFSALFRESGLVLAPLFYTMRARRLVDVQAAVQAILLVLPTVLVLAAVRLLIPAWNEDADYVATLPPAVQSVVHSAVPSYDLVDTIERYVGIRLEAFSEGGLTYLYAMTFAVYGVPITVLAIIGALADRQLLGRVGLMLLVPYAQLLLSWTNQRNFVVGFPAAILLAAAGITFLMSRLRISFWPFLIAAVALYAAGLLDPQRPFVLMNVQIGLLVASGLLIAAWARVLRSAETVPAAEGP
jgi:hypothetical protein